MWIVIEKFFSDEIINICKDIKEIPLNEKDIFCKNMVILKEAVCITGLATARERYTMDYLILRKVKV